eukprot:CAMPEP_0113473382 /NCGR_PEP_ID=MMETSP0014_2-20120614/18016_1 /TAXON_ID=2857 /ORGANISM="Nitzschia sp." /LENGTH=500 /DNA_ID=CAMNT_0000366149 /DNA_START=519 /DNA_END=2021 /DNA_ORIENTATION=- /assembly_acc=CAM_ASM_000159
MSTSATDPIAKYIPLGRDACEFLTKSPDPFHAVANCSSKLETNGFTKLDVSVPLKGRLEPGGKYYYIVEYSTIVAFAVGLKFQPSEAFGFHMLGGHTDSPNLKIKPKSKRSASGYVQLGVECYGGGLWHTWFDRDLSVSGRVLVQKKKKGDGQSPVLTEQRLVNLEDPVARISTLCIHLQSADERKAFAVNKENHTAPVIATTKIQSQANEDAKIHLETSATDQVNNNHGTWRDGQEPLLLQAIANKLDVSVEDIVDFELNLYDTQPACLGGMTKEFLYSARLDNLATVFAGMEALVQYTKGEDFETSSDVSLVVAFDHEEVGSTSAQGAGSPVMADAVQRITSALAATTNDHDFYNSCIRKSFVLSIDQAHAIHPNYSSKHESLHAPKLGDGIVIKTNSNQRYATTGVTGFFVRELGRMANVPVQEFVVRNDCPCGSTIGPTISASTGIRVVDAGMPQLSMHSVREVMSVVDLTYGVDIFRTFFEKFRTVDESLCKEIK